MQQVWAVGVLAPQKLGWVPWTEWGVQNPLCWGDEGVVGKVGGWQEPVPVSLGVPMGQGLPGQGVLLGGSPCLSFPG